jgi:hypothetical protein
MNRSVAKSRYGMRKATASLDGRNQPGVETESAVDGNTSFKHRRPYLRKAEWPILAQGTGHSSERNAWIIPGGMARPENPDDSLMMAAGGIPASTSCHEE